MSKAKIKCVCYCRVSTGSKEQYNSFENQKEFFERYIKEHPEYVLYKSKTNPTGIYADRGISGTLLHREQFEAMLEAAGLVIEKVEYKDLPRKDSEGREVYITYRDYTYKFSKETPKFSLILVKNTSRFSRNILITDVLRKLAAIGVYVKFLDIDKSTENESDLTIIQFFQTFDEMFSRDLSRKLLSANEQSRQNQILRSNYDLFGYQYHKRKNRTENNHLTIIEEEAYIVQMIFRLYFGCFKVNPNTTTQPPMPPCNFDCDNCSIRYEVENEEGLGFKNIRLILNDLYKFRTRKGGEFAQSTLKHIFENEKYCGYLNNGKWDHGPLFNRNASPKLKENYQDYLYYRPDLIPPIISKTLFDLCTHKREKKAEVFKPGLTVNPSKYQGLLYCGECGSVMTHNIGNNGNGLYNCRTKKLKTSKHCNNGNIYDYQFEEFLKELCNGGIAEDIELKNRWLIDTCIVWIEEKLGFIKRNRDTVELNEMNDKIQQYTQALSKLYTQQALSSTVPAAITQSINDLTEQLNNLETEYAKLTKKPAHLIKECADLIEICYTGLNAIENPKATYTEEELLEVVERFVVYSEVQKIRGGMHGPPKVSVVPILKTEHLLSTKYGITYNPTAPLSYFNIGFENENITGQIKERIDGLDRTIKDLENLYFSSMD